MDPREGLQLNRPAAAERLRARLARNVLRGAIHEMNNPITGVVNLSQLIAERLPFDHPLRPLAETVVQECNRIAAFTRMLWEYSSEIDSGSAPAAVSAAELTQKALKLYGRQLQMARVQTETSVSADLVYVNGQSALHGLLHILGFAVQFLTTRAPSHSAGPPLQISGAPLSDAQFELQIVEAGAAVADEYREPADSAQEAHLGVAAAREFVERSGGRLALYADPAAAIVVRIQFPLFRPGSPP